MLNKLGPKEPRIGNQELESIKRVSIELKKRFDVNLDRKRNIVAGLKRWNVKLPFTSSC